jgi:hypothetical protein
LVGGVASAQLRSRWLDRSSHAAARSFSMRVVTVVRHSSVTKKCRVTTKKSIEFFPESFSARVVIVVRHSSVAKKIVG